MSAPPQVSLSPAELGRAATVAALARDGGTGVDALLTFLSDPSWPVRRQAVAGLAGIGQVVIDPLCRLLISPRLDEAQIAAIVDALTLVRGDPFPALTTLAGHANPAVLADVAQIFGRRRLRESTPLLVSMVTHEDDNVAVAAIEALGRIGGPGGIDALVQAAASGNFFRVFPAIDVLGRSEDPRALAPLIELLASPTYKLEAARALGRTGEASAIPGLAQLLASPSEGTARVAAVAICELIRSHGERFGLVDRVEDALRRAHPGGAALRRLGLVLGGADRAEKEAIALILGILGGDDAPAVLCELLDAGDTVAEVAAHALRRQAAESELELRAALKAGDPARRRVLLGVVSRSSALPEVMGCLTDDDAGVRVLACDALARIGASTAVPALFARLADPSPRVVQAAIVAIQSLGTDVTRELALGATRHPEPEVRRAALRILAYFGFPGTLPAFVEALAGDDPRLGEIALGGVALLDEPGAVETLLAAGTRELPRLRSAAMRALGHSIADDPRIGDALGLGLTDADAWVRYYACQALGRRRTAGASAAIASLLEDVAGQVRVAAVEALARFGDEASIASLCRAAAGAEEDVRRAALLGLGHVRQPGVLAILLDGARAADPATRLVAISALAEAGDAAALTAAVSDPDDNVRAAAIGFASALPGRAGVEALIGPLATAGPRDRERILRHLARPGPERVAALLGALAASEEEHLPGLVAALVRMRTPGGTEALRSAALSPTPALRRAAASGLAAVGSPDALSTLEGLAVNDPDQEVREVCAILLARG